MAQVVVAGYTRISRVGGRKGDGFISKDDQREGISTRAEQLGLTIGDWYHDQDYTGGNMQRPEWEALMARILDPADELKGVIVVRVDRFARTVPEGAPEVKRIWDSEGIFVAADLPVDTTTPFGRKTLWDWLSNAELQLEMLKAQWKRTKKRAIKRGAHIGATPFGYLRRPAGDGSGVLIPDPERAWVVPKIFERTNAGHSQRAIARWLDEVCPRQDGRLWTHSSIASILRNRTYLGELRYRQDALSNPKAHEPLVDEVTWQRAQRPMRAVTDTAVFFALSGLVRCAGCMHAMAGQSCRGAYTPLYRCLGRHGAGRCPQPVSISSKRLDAYVMERVNRHVQGIVVDLKESSTEREAVFAELAAADQALRRDMADTALHRRLEVLGVSKEEYMEPAMKRLADARKAARAVETSPTGEVLREDLSSLSHDELRSYLCGFVDAVVVRRGSELEDRVCILWAGELEDDLAPRSGRHARPLRSFTWPNDLGDSPRMASA